jgi:hypothetical protein
MAASILKGLNFPSLVSFVEIDAAGKKLVQARNCTVSGINTIDSKEGGLSFSRLDEALPLLPADAVSILPSASILDELNVPIK